MGSEFTANADLQLIRYAQVWEDHRVLESALQVGPEDEVLSIGSAGSNVLALLAQGPRSITAVDISPAQIAMLELKLAAIRQLPHRQYLVLLGVDADAQDAAARAAIYQQLRGELPLGVQEFWDSHPAELHEGLMHCGSLERYLRYFHTQILRVHAPPVIERLFGFSDIEEQSLYFAQRVATPEFCAVYHHCFGRQFIRGRGRDQSQYRYVESDPGVEGMRRLHELCGRVLLCGNPYMLYWLRGRAAISEVVAAHALPELRPDSYALLRELLPRVRVVLDDVEHCLQEEPAGRFSKANLSDIFEYMSEVEAGRLFRLLGERLRPGGRIAYWNLLVPRAVKPSDTPRLRSRRDEAARLHLSDRLYVYEAFHLEEALSP